jgi:hypothetical protein
VTLDFWMYPDAITAGSGVDVSVSIGGDVTTGESAFGYANVAGVTSPGKSKVVVCQLGSARAASDSVFVNNLDSR